MVEVSAHVRGRSHGIDRAVVGRTLDLTTLRKLDIEVKKVGFSYSEIKYLGGLSVMIFFDEQEEVAVFIESMVKERLIFSSLVRWEGQVLPFIRIAWLKIIGVPLHLLENEVFDSIGRLFGKVIHPSQISDDSGDLTFDIVGVLVGDGVEIDQEVTLLWENKRFKVWIREESRDWIPYFLKVEDGSSQVDNSEPFSVGVGIATGTSSGEGEKPVEEVRASPGNPDMSMQDQLPRDETFGFPRWEDAWEDGEIRDPTIPRFSSTVYATKRSKLVRAHERSKGKKTINVFVSDTGVDRPRKRPRADNPIYEAKKMDLGPNKEGGVFSNSKSLGGVNKHS
ncbi:hypothetical protein HanPI659440_Chr17g0679321 [Helianthus annuus]|nr:hypothetical protein HanPI659440_Chr17g0679321 [Helianthus annuus]